MDRGVHDKCEVVKMGRRNIRGLVGVVSPNLHADLHHAGMLTVKIYISSNTYFGIHLALLKH